MNHFLPDDRLRRFLMLLFIVLAVIELSRGSFVWGVIDIIFAASFSPRLQVWAQTQWARIFKKS